MDSADLARALSLSTFGLGAAKLSMHSIRSAYRLEVRLSLLKNFSSAKPSRTLFALMLFQCAACSSAMLAFQIVSGGSQQDWRVLWGVLRSAVAKASRQERQLQGCGNQQSILVAIASISSLAELKQPFCSKDSAGNFYMSNAVCPP